MKHLTLTAFALLVMGLLFPSFAHGQQCTEHEWKAIGTMRTIVVCQQQYRILKKSGTVPPQYGTFSDLVKHDMIDKDIEDGVRNGYRYKMTFNKSKTQFQVVATPISPRYGNKKFYADNSGRITYSTKGTPDRKSSGVYNLRRPRVNPQREFQRALQYFQRGQFDRGMKTLQKLSRPLQKQLGRAQRQFQRNLRGLDRQFGMIQRQFQRELRGLSRQFQRQLRGLDRQLQRSVKPEQIEGLLRQLPPQVRNLPPVRNLMRNLQQARMAANETSAIGALRTLVTSNHQFRILKKKMKNGRPQYGTLQELAQHGFIDKRLASGYKSGYRFKLTLKNNGTQFEILATPINSKMGRRSFYTDNSGRVTYTLKGTPDRNSPGVD